MWGRLGNELPAEARARYGGTIVLHNFRRYFSLYGSDERNSGWDWTQGTRSPHASVDHVVNTSSITYI